MPRYLIERTVPGAHTLTPEQLHAISNRSCDVLDELGTAIQWQQSFVTEDRITCVYIARDADLVREHARRGDFPADRVSQIVCEISPTTAEPRTHSTH